MGKGKQKKAAKAAARQSRRLRGEQPEDVEDQLDQERNRQVSPVVSERAASAQRVNPEDRNLVDLMADRIQFLQQKLQVAEANQRPPIVNEPQTEDFLGEESFAKILARIESLNQRKTAPSVILDSSEESRLRMSSSAEATRVGSTGCGLGAGSQTAVIPNPPTTSHGAEEKDRSQGKTYSVKSNASKSKSVKELIERSQLKTRKLEALQEAMDKVEQENIRIAQMKQDLNCIDSDNESQKLSDGEEELDPQEKTKVWASNSIVDDVEKISQENPEVMKESLSKVENKETTAAELMSVMKNFFQGETASRAPNADSTNKILLRQTMGKPLPDYHGTPEEWPGFIEEYRRSTEACRFSDVENLYRIRKCLKGNALEAVKSMLIVPENVPDILKTLEMNFGQPEMIVEVMIKKAREIPPATEGKPQTMIDLINAVKNLVVTVTHLKKKTHLQNPELLKQLANKLPESEKIRWIEEKIEKEDVDVSLFSSWLEKRARIANELRVLLPLEKDSKKPQEKANVKGNTSKPQKFQGRKFDQRRPEVCASNVGNSDSNLPSTNAKQCSYCEKQGHLLYTCHWFLKIKVEDRWRWARGSKACYNCLQPLHSREDCPHMSECGINGCPRFHHQLLHPTNWKPSDDRREYKREERRGERREEKRPEVLEEKREEKPQEVQKEASKEKKPAKGFNCHVTDIRAATSRVLLEVLPIVLQGPKGEIQTYALLDSASTTTIMEDSLAKELGIRGEELTVSNQWIDGETKTKTIEIADLRIRNPWRWERYLMEKVQIHQELLLPMQSVNAKEMASRWPHLRGFEYLTFKNAKPRILIGKDNRYLIMPREFREGPKNAPAVSRCVLGWAISGNNVGAHERIDNGFNLHVFQKENPVVRGILHGGEPDGNEDFLTLESLHQLVKNSFSTESFGVKVKEENLLTTEDKRVLNLAETTTRKVGERWETGLLWKSEEIKLPHSKHTAVTRLSSQERKMDRDSEFGEAYCKQMQDFIDKGYARKLTNVETINEGERTWYLPHFGHVNPNKPGKIRLVFDAAARSNGVSLNDNLLKGMNLVTPLPNCLFGFREKAVGFCGDIKEMFPQVMIKKEDRSSQRFLYRGMSRSIPPDVYEMQVMIFGSASSPFSAQYVKNKNAECHAEEFPGAAKAIINKHYVDDYLDSVDTVEEAVKMISEVHEVHSRGGFNIVNFMSSSREVLDSLPKEIVAEKHKDLALDDEYPIERVLGLYWDPKTDCFSFRTSFERFRKEVMSGESSPTKREVLAIVMTIYDILGFISHYTIKAKILLQDVWRLKIGWDDELPEELFEKWKMWLGELSEISKVKIPRCYTPRMAEGDVQLHIFVDGSEEAFTAVAYFRIELDGQVTTALVTAKAKVAPLKRLSVPRLELQAAVLGTRMAEWVRNSHSVKVSATHYWSDSSTVLSWIRTDGKRLPVFVAHRVGEIAESTDVKDWHWIPTKENVADEATRSGIPTEFGPESRWFQGPDFLKKGESHWPKDKTEEELKSIVNPEDMELKKEWTGHSIDVSVIQWNRYSSWSRLKRTVAYVLRFIAKCKEKKAGKVRGMLLSPSKTLTAEEIDRAELELLRQAQRESFPEELAALEKGRVVHRRSRLLRLSPMKDERGLIVIRGRTIRAPGLDAGAKSPIILDPKHYCTKLIIEKYHQLAGHHGTERVLNELRQKFWIIDAREAIKKITRNCQWCKVEKPKISLPEMAPLPKFRLTQQVRPFTITGLDYFGPMTVTIGRRHEKRYGALFTCLTTRAVHMELAASLSTDSAIMALRRFVARRGCPTELYTDNGTNFHGANNELKKAIAEIDNNSMAAELGERGISWRFIPPGAPHMGGAWERMVRCIKTALYATLKERAPKEEVLLTLLAEAEHSVNSRPLTRVSGDPEDMESLTPNHFLLGTSSGVHQWGHFDGDLCLRKQWRVSQALADMFWKRWMTEYVPSLTTRSKWHKENEPMKVGDVVFVADGNLKRNEWPRGRITAIHPGKDGKIRVVDVKTSNGEYRRPVAKIALIDTQTEDWRIEPESNLGGEDVTTRTDLHK